MSHDIVVACCNIASPVAWSGGWIQRKARRHLLLPCSKPKVPVAMLRFSFWLISPCGSVSSLRLYFLGVSNRHYYPAIMYDKNPTATPSEPFEELRACVYWGSLRNRHCRRRLGNCHCLLKCKKIEVLVVVLKEKSLVREI